MSNSVGILQSKAVLILGNGVSLRNLNYAALPLDVDVFRVNQFYFEDVYFSGKRIDLALTAANFAVHQKFFTLQNLQDRGEYEIAKLVFQESNSGMEDLMEIERFYPQVLRLSNMILADSQMSWWGDFVYRQYNAYGQGPTNGVNMLALALSMGYRQIYVGGIDFYVGSEGHQYGFSMHNKKVLGKMFSPEHLEAKGYNPWHAISIDKFVIEKCRKMVLRDGGFIYNVGQGSPLGELLPNAPNLSSQATLADRAGVREAKPVSYIDDIMVMPKMYVDRFREPLS